jgi:hypothetical protein
MPHSIHTQSNSVLVDGSLPHDEQPVRQHASPIDFCAGSTNSYMLQFDFAGSSLAFF